MQNFCHCVFTRFSLAATMILSQGLGGLNEHRYFQVFGSLHGEELAYGLGMPLTGGSNHLKQNYTFQEQVLSEVMMHYWGNFAKTG